jgi:NAD(P)-dependent dehydrogenase (short-subunit alcohol dehydrogenase family)
VPRRDVAVIDQMVTRVMATFGRIDILVNNAGVTRRAYIMDLIEAEWERIAHVRDISGHPWTSQDVPPQSVPFPLQGARVSARYALAMLLTWCVTWRNRGPPSPGQ